MTFFLSTTSNCSVSSYFRGMKHFLVLFLVNTSFLFSQTATGQAPLDLKQETRIFPKPPAYDSTRTLEEQYKPENQPLFIGMQLYLPPVINPEAGPVLFSISGNNTRIGNKTYTVVDIFSESPSGRVVQLPSGNLCGYRYKIVGSPAWEDQIIHAVFVLRDNKPSDSLQEDLYWVVCEGKQAPFSASNLNAFIPVPWFSKIKQTYLHQSVIHLGDKSKWFCKDVLISKVRNTASVDSSYEVFCLLTNEKGEQMQLRPPSEKSGRSFITEKEYLRLDHANRNEKEELLKAEQEKAAEHLHGCIKRFGQQKGELVAQGRIEKGMSTEMCKTAWGAPWDITKTNTPNGVRETWFYNWKYKLSFENGLLVLIGHD